MSKTKLSETLEAISRGDGAAQKQLSQEIYNQLRVIARHRLGGQARTNLNTTVLVHEAYLKILDVPDADDRMDRARFFALASKTMRNLLVDYLRARNAVKRGGGQIMATLDLDRENGDDGKDDLIDVLAVDKALQALGKIDARLVNVVECRFFAGMNYDEIALAHDMSERTVRRDWRRARAFLRAHMDEQPLDEQSLDEQALDDELP
ncbi:sigma-70 family RNA polymerase sigma factor [Luteimonas gilva]|uniref:Sigma-70 family RNA polymerase sigma factor n=1 Tax=Luteimonas gilva TaxID=2572684 RepID=A0A4U5JV14_9GAMM|nr:ECF-type sigma factor [Luteimonas gilva]TKR30259.1 sigma-70 family RNA polymerase sigma factor [Luteimonas gilva]